MNIVGLKIIGHDTGAALISGNKVVAIAEERLNRVKHSPNMFPEKSLSYCLSQFNLSPKDIDLVVIDQIGLPEEVQMKKIFLEKTKGIFSKARIEVINHHDAHAASAFFVSPFKEAAILVCDGAGEKFKTHLGIIANESETLYYGSGDTFYPIQKTMHIRDGKIYPYTFGIGKLYTHLSQMYIGLGVYNEGKMMGLAPYGSDSVLKQFPREMWCKEVNGHILCNSRIISSPKTITQYARNYTYLLPAVKRRIQVFFNRLSRKIVGLFQKNVFSEPDIFPVIRLPRPPRESDVLPDDYYSSVAYTGQKVLEWVMVGWAQKLKDITASDNLVVAGGVGLNIDANKKYIDEVGFKHLFIQPAATDTGIALGCALYGKHVIYKEPRFWTMKSASLGRSYTDEEILEAIRSVKDSVIVEKLSPEKKFDKVADLLAKGAITGWFSGGAEYGPRALGNRSILCDARREDMRDILNLRVKHREAWRPFAASVLTEYVSEYFDLNFESPFMLIAAQVKEKYKKAIPSVVHIDGTCRIQSVTKEGNGPYHSLLNAFYRKTKTPLLLNTSFNLGGEPIVETPQDALSSFLRTDMDYLVLEDYLIQKTNHEK